MKHQINETPLHKELRIEAQFSRAAQLKIIELRARIVQLEKELKLTQLTHSFLPHV